MSKIFTTLAFCLLFGFLMFCLLFVFIIEMGWAFTYEGELDPNVFTTWKAVEVEMIGFQKAVAIVQNPDSNADVQRIQMIIHINGTLLSYKYFKNGEIYSYKINIEMDRYERRKYTDRERRACMKCRVGLITEPPI